MPLHQKNIRTRRRGADDLAQLTYTIASACGTILSVLLLSFVSFIGLSVSEIGGTLSYFNDIEISEGNSLRAGILGLLLSSSDDEAERRSAQSSSVGTASFTVTLGEREASLPLLYRGTGKIDAQSPAGCAALTLEAWLGDSYHYTGLFTDFNVGTSTMGTWQFLLTLPLDQEGTGTLLPEALCYGDFVFKAELADVPSELSHSFTDEKRHRFEIRNWNNTPALVIEESTLLIETELVVPDLPELPNLPELPAMPELPELPEVEEETAPAPVEVTEETAPAPIEIVVETPIE